MRRFTSGRFFAPPNGAQLPEVLNYAHQVERGFATRASADTKAADLIVMVDMSRA
jgi:hypothetical protein